MGDSAKALASLEGDVERLGLALDLKEWERIRQRCGLVQIQAGGMIQNQLDVADRWVFLTSGIAASEQTWIDGGSTIARFFEAGDFCTNVTSAWTGDIASDDLIALTDVAGLAIPNDIFRREYLTGGSFGIYLRHKLMDAHLFAKDLVCAKTSGQTETRYQFLEQHHKDVVGSVQKKDIARFLGVTPQGLSRFLRRRKSASG